MTAPPNSLAPLEPLPIWERHLMPFSGQIEPIEAIVNPSIDTPEKFEEERIPIRLVCDEDQKFIAPRSFRWNDFQMHLSIRKSVLDGTLERTQNRLGIFVSFKGTISTNTRKKFEQLPAGR
ncbi:MAG: hypothetical protein IPK50_07850 [Fibrobacterota bacterium]|nr:hypothetical protein [Fibrobacterota bacterium]QQS06804.1 MAG: hypothetical protein IPK50_07850 [Fibrobacterota bacterium]